MKSKNLVDAMCALNVVRARRKEIARIDRAIDSDDPKKTNFRITNDNGDSFGVGDGKYFLAMIREMFSAEIEVNLEVLDSLGIEIESDDEESEDDEDGTD